MARRGWIAFAMAAVLTGCSSAQPSVPPSASVAPSTPVESGATIDPSAPAATASPPDLTEQPIVAPARIAAALEAGRIDYGTSLLYRAYALYDDPQLPDEYLGNVPEEDTALFSEIALAGDRLSDDIRQELVPYTVRPDDPRSIHAQPLGATTDTPAAALAAGAVLAQVTNQQAVLCGTDGWAKLASPKGFKVWSQCTGDTPTTCVSRMTCWNSFGARKQS